MHLGESGLDFGEQQWGVAVSLDLDFDTLVAGIGFTKQTLATLAKDPGAPCRPLPGTS
jgi:dynactin 1